MAQGETPVEGVAWWLGTVSETVRSVISFVETVLKWALLLAFAVVWIVFWGNLAWLHLSMGHVPASIVSAVPLILPPLALLFVLRPD